ncbi:MAG: glutamine amidotransferase [Betaproteobacteria bacterium]
MLDSLFRLLFKYRPLVFQQGDVAFDVTRLTIGAIVVAAAAGAYALFTYRLPGGRPRDRALLVALRAAALVVVVACLFRPTLVLRAAVPQQNFLGILVDDSRSMQIADGGGPRSDFVRSALAPDGPLARALAQKFVLRYFRFSSGTDRIATPARLDYTGTATRVGQALDRARDELAGLPLAGLVLVSDGADTSTTTLDASLASLKARSIPVFTVGVGRERFARDIQVSRVDAPRTTLKGTSLVVNAVVTEVGYGGQTVPLVVEDEGRIIGTEQVALPPDGGSATVPVHVTASEAGARTFRFRVPPQPGEQVTQNNARDVLVEVRDQREKILYYEGEPRFEAKFVLRAVEDDKNLQVVLLERTAKDKYYRRNVASADELAAGFPKTREELFKYQGVILGSVEADAFTPEQIRMLADFVSRRGGGLLLLGGRRSFAEGGWADTPLADVMPLTIERAARSTPYFAEMGVRPTRDGAGFPLTRIADTDAASMARWRDLPPLTSVNAVGEPKPGATVLLTGTTTNRAAASHPVLAFQRYGRGTAIAFAVQDSWLWQMNPKTPASDPTYATFWRRLARWLVDGVPGRVTVTTTEDRVDPGQPIALTANASDASYLEENDSQLIAHVTAPSGRTSDVPLEWSVVRNGEYRGSFVPDETGTYDVRVTATRAGKEEGRAELHVRAVPGAAEYFDAAMRAPLLRRIADDTGGRFFTPADVSRLPEAISYGGRGVTVVEERELWDMPVVLLLLVALTGAEWAYRRARGLA